jgi:3-dehydroquinate synthetase
MALWTKWIKYSNDIKLKIVSMDPTEQGARKLLNWGHNVGHALETSVLKEGKLSLVHGEAVAIGMLAETYYCCSYYPELEKVAGRLEWCVANILMELEGDDLVSLSKHWEAEHLWTLMAKDKKNRDGKMRFVLLRAPGDCFTSADVPVEAVEQLLRDEGAV